MALSNDTGILVLMVYLTWRCDLQGRLVIDMEKLDGIFVLEVNTTCTDIAHSCLETMHSLTATVSYPVGKGNCWKHSRIGLSWVVRQAGGEGCVSSRHRGSLELFLTALYGQPQAAPWLKSTTIMDTRKLVRIMSPPPTDLNLFVHVHFQMLPWKATE